MKAPRKTPNPIDSHVGSRVRLRRILVGLSQEKLGDHLGVTFQQIQKYEKGSNRISASKLQQISKVLQSPVSFFFEGAPTGDMPAGGFSEKAAAAYTSEFMTSGESVELAKAFARIRSARVRRRILDLVEALAEQDDARPGKPD